MSYLDEKILQKRDEKRKQRFHDLDKGYYVAGEIIKFKRKDVLDSFSILLPEKFKLMPEEIARVKYPSEFRPSRIYTSRNLSINFCFSVFPKKLKAEDMKQLADRMMNTIHKENPGYRFLDLGELEKTGGSWFSFRSHGMDADLYNAMFVSSRDGCILQGAFNCPYEKQMEWKHIVLPVWESIGDIERREKEA